MSDHSISGYNPYEHRQVALPTTNAETLFHLLKGCLGTGILAMPNAFRISGYVIGVIGTTLIGILCTYCIHKLIKVEYEVCRRNKVPSMSYQQTAVAALKEGPEGCKKCAPYIGHVVNLFILMYQLGTCCVYVIFVSSNIKSVADFYLDTELSVRVWMLIILLPLILINYIRNLKYLAPFSTLGNAITFVSFGFICYYVFRDPISVENRTAVGEPLVFPLFFGTVLFALAAIGVIMPLENEMKTPQYFGGTFGVLNIDMFIIIILYVGMGLFGYLRYGEDVEGSITLNLPAEDVMSQLVKATLAFAIFISHALNLYVAIDLVWNDYTRPRMDPEGKLLFWEFVLRTALVLITFLLAAAIPNLELFISFFGALCLSALALGIPALLEISTHWYNTEGGAKAWLLIGNIIIIILGILGLVVGTSTAISEIVATFTHPDRENALLFVVTFH